MSGDLPKETPEVVISHGGGGAWGMPADNNALDIEAILRAEEVVSWAGEVLAVCGINREMAIANPFTRGANMASGGSARRLEASLARMEATKSTAAVISFGLAGGLDPGLRVGDVICARAIDDGERLLPTDPEWTRLIAERTGAKIIDCVSGSDHLATTPAMKAEMFARAGAATVDMESHIMARWAARSHIPTAVLRVVSDASRHALPSSAVAGMGEDGKVHVGAVLTQLARRPWQLPELIRTSRNVGAALGALKRAATAAGAYLAFPEERVYLRKSLRD